MKSDHCSKFSNLSNWKEEALKNVRASTGIENVTSAKYRSGVLAQSPEPEAHDKVLDNSRSNWNLEMLVFEGRGKPEYPEKNLSEQGREQQTTNSTHM